MQRKKFATAAVLDAYEMSDDDSMDGRVEFRENPPSESYCPPLCPNMTHWPAFFFLAKFRHVTFTYSPFHRPDVAYTPIRRYARRGEIIVDCQRLETFDSASNRLVKVWWKQWTGVFFGVSLSQKNRQWYFAYLRSSWDCYRAIWSFRLLSSNVLRRRRNKDAKGTRANSLKLNTEKERKDAITKCPGVTYNEDC